MLAQEINKIKMVSIYILISQIGVSRICALSMRIWPVAMGLMGHILRMHGTQHHHFPEGKRWCGRLRETWSRMAGKKRTAFCFTVFWFFSKTEKGSEACIFITNLISSFVIWKSMYAWRCQWHSCCDSKSEKLHSICLKIST